MEQKNILVTGGAGFIGSNLVAHQLAKGNKVRVVENLITGRTTNLELYMKNPDSQFDQADISDWKNLSQAVEWQIIFSIWLQVWANASFWDIRFTQYRIIYTAAKPF